MTCSKGAVVQRFIRSKGLAALAARPFERINLSATILSAFENAKKFMHQFLFHKLLRKNLWNQCGVCVTIKSA